MPDKGRILLVEDDRDIRDTLVFVLEEEGYEVHGAENGKEALELLKKIHSPCLILLDLFMPVMSGPEFLEALKSSHVGVIASIPIILMTAAPPGGEMVKSAGSSAAGLIRKPIDLGVFLTVVKSYCAL